MIKFLIPLVFWISLIVIFGTLFGRDFCVQNLGVETTNFLFFGSVIVCNAILVLLFFNYMVERVREHFNKN